jgi:hypothetical protein
LTAFLIQKPSADARWRAAFMPLERETKSLFEKLECLAGIDVEAA